MDWLDQFISPGVQVTVALITFLTTLGAAIFFYVKSRRRKILAYGYTGERLLGLQNAGLPADITVQFRGNDIPRLTRSLIVFWNAGEVTITSDDLIQKDPLRLVLPEDSDILSVSVLKTSRDVTDFKTHANVDRPNEIEITFDFLDSNDGAVIEVLHTSESREAKVHGTVRGIPRGIRNLGTLASRARRERVAKKAWSRFMTPGFIGSLAILLGAILVGIPLYTSVETSTSQSNSRSKEIALVVAAGATYIIIGILILCLGRRRYPRELHIKELE